MELPVSQTKEVEGVQRGEAVILIQDEPVEGVRFLPEDEKVVQHQAMRCQSWVVCRSERNWVGREEERIPLGRRSVQREGRREGYLILLRD